MQIAGYTLGDGFPAIVFSFDCGVEISEHRKSRGGLVEARTLVVQCV
jgi:hypothetical protein